jgi:hypothetical protein
VERRFAVRFRSLALAATFGVVVTMASIPAEADVSFSGKGYYLETAVTTPIDVVVILIGGPYPSESVCKAALAALPEDKQHASSCRFETQDPNKDTE